MNAMCRDKALNRRSFIKLAGLSIKTVCAMQLLPKFSLAAEATETQTSQPNVILFLTDDQGYGDLSLHGNPDVKTPHMDSLAKDSIELAISYLESRQICIDA